MSSKRSSRTFSCVHSPVDERVDLEPRRGKGGQLCAVRGKTPAERKSHARFLWESGSGDESASAEVQEILSNLNLLVLMFERRL